MITGFDHLVIAVRSLETDIELFAAAGFEVEPGGRHPERGTCNAMIGLRNGYVELISVEDPVTARGVGGNIELAVEFLQHNERGVVSFAVSSGDIDEDTQRLARAGYAPRGPERVRRERPDGQEVSFQLAFPRGATWHRPWPFVVERHGPDGAQRRARPHPNGVHGLTRLVVSAHEWPDAYGLYCLGLGLAPVELSDGSASFAVGTAMVDLTLAAGDAIAEVRFEGSAFKPRWRAGSATLAAAYAPKTVVRIGDLDPSGQSLA